MSENKLDFFAGLEDNFTPAPTVDVVTKDDDKVTDLEKNVFEQEVVDEKDEEVEDTKDTTETTTEDKDDIYQVYFEDLKDKDFLDLPEDFEFKGTEDSLKEALEVSKTRIAEKTREDIVAGFQDFVYKNLEQIQNTYNTVDFEQVDLSDEATQKEVVKYYLKKTTKFKDEQIEKKVNQLEQFAELEDEAKTALDELKVLDKEEKDLLARQAADYEVAQAKARQDADKLFRKTLKETDEVSGIKINKDRVFNSLYNTIKLEDGTVTTSFNKNLQEVLSDPKKTIFLAHLLENNFELNKIEDTKVNTKAAKVLKEKLRQAGLSSSAKTRGGDLSKPGKLSLEDFS
jgi:hypothetical protein